MLNFNVKCTLKLCGIFTLISIAIFTSLISMISIFKNIFIYGRLQLQNKKELNNNLDNIYLLLRYIITPLFIILISIIFFEFVLKEKLPKGERIPSKENDNEYSEVSNEIII